jgi:hypothetical protein
MSYHIFDETTSKINKILHDVIDKNEWNAPKDGKHYWKDDEGKWKRK